MPERRDFLRLLCCPGVGAAAAASLRDDPAGEASAALLRRLRQQVDERAVDRVLVRARSLDAAVICLSDDDYPPPLRALPDPPPVLFVRGRPSTLLQPQVAMVGSRRASAAGRRLAGWLAAELCRAGLAVTSGLARGIDAAAHRGALDAGGVTLAVLGHGVDRVYPAAHRRLAGEIVEAGALVTEFAPGTPVAAHHFPRRNRIVSGLGLGVVVVEAAERSGSLITARLAAEQGREVFALPGPPRDAGMRGCHRLIQQGAKLVTDVGEILEEIGHAAQAQAQDMAQLMAPPLSPSRPAASDPAGSDSDALAGVLASLDAEGAEFDQLVARSGLDAAALAEALLTLEIDGRVLREGTRFVRAPLP